MKETPILFKKQEQAAEDTAASGTVFPDHKRHLGRGRGAARPPWDTTQLAHPAGTGSRERGLLTPDPTSRCLRPTCQSEPEAASSRGTCRRGARPRCGSLLKFSIAAPLWACASALQKEPSGPGC